MLFQYFIIHFRIRTLFIEQIHTKADADVITISAFSFVTRVRGSPINGARIFMHRS